MVTKIRKNSQFDTISFIFLVICLQDDTKKPHFHQEILHQYVVNEDIPLSYNQ